MLINIVESLYMQKFEHPYLQLDWIKSYLLVYIVQKPMSTPESNITEAISKKPRAGRWTQAQSALFQELIEKYGKNWKKIHSFLKGRTLSQIRSHAQKFFERIGPSRVHDYERKAKLIEAIQILENEKLLTQQFSLKPDLQEQRPAQLAVKKEENATLEKEMLSQSPELKNGQRELINPEYIKEQFKSNLERKPQAPIQNDFNSPPPTHQHQNQCLFTPIIWLSNPYGMNGLGAQTSFYNQNFQYQNFR